MRRSLPLTPGATIFFDPGRFPLNHGWLAVHRCRWRLDIPVLGRKPSELASSFAKHRFNAGDKS